MLGMTLKSASIALRARALASPVYSHKQRAFSAGRNLAARSASPDSDRGSVPLLFGNSRHGTPSSSVLLSSPWSHSASIHGAKLLHTTKSSFTAGDKKIAEGAAPAAPATTATSTATVASKASVEPKSVAKSTSQSQSESDWQIIRKLLVHVWPQNDSGAKVRVVTAMGLLIAGKILNVQVPMIFKDIVDRLGEYGVTIPDDGSQTLYNIAGAMLVGYGLARVGAAGFSELRNAVFVSVAQKAIRRVALGVFSHLHSLDLKYHLTRQTGGLTRAMDRGTKGISFLLTAVVFNIVPTAFEISIVCGILASKYGMKYAAVTASTMALYAAFTLGVTSWRTKIRQQMNKADNRAATVAVDSLLNYESVKYFNNESFEAKQYGDALRDYEKAAIKTGTSLAFLNAGQNFIFSAALTVMMWMASESVLEGTMTVGDLVLINGIVFQLSLPLNFLGSVYREMRQALTDMETLFNMQGINSQVKDISGAKPLLLPAPKTSLVAIQDQINKAASSGTLTSNEAIREAISSITPAETAAQVPVVSETVQYVTPGEIKFENVTFGYHEDRRILDNVSFTIPPGAKVAFVGPSGCGKSTILRLLFRFYDPDNGRILINGQDIKTVQLDSLRRAIGVVPQDTPLFNNTVLYNIAYGRPGASREEIEQAADMAGFSDVIKRLQNGWETTVGERGLMLSGGEKQRAALARAILKNPPIMMFDEATSALDTHTEKKLLANIRGVLGRPTSANGSSNVSNDGSDGDSSLTPLSRPKTSIFIAHRLRTIVDADLIVVLHSGRVVEMGTHSQLLHPSPADEQGPLPIRGIYRNMWWSQEMAEDLATPTATQ